MGRSQVPLWNYNIWFVRISCTFCTRFLDLTSFNVRIYVRLILSAKSTIDTNKPAVAVYEYGCAINSFWNGSVLTYKSFRKRATYAPLTFVVPPQFERTTTKIWRTRLATCVLLKNNKYCVFYIFILLEL